jgi:hypothetical protein
VLPLSERAGIAAMMRFAGDGLQHLELPARFFLCNSFLVITFSSSGPRDGTGRFAVPDNCVDYAEISGARCRFVYGNCDDQYSAACRHP